MNILKSSMVNCFIVCFLAFSCNYLDIVPSDIPSIDHAFRNRNEAMNYLYGLLGGMPDVGNLTQDPALAGSDEIWIREIVRHQNVILRRLLLGEQTPVNPYVNYWSSKQNSFSLNGGKSLWTTITDCNIFLENIHKPFDLTEPERTKWIGEALFVKAYLHFWLFRQYGPIPLMRENYPIDSDAMPYREPVDECVDYIVSLLDQAIDLLPLRVEFDVLEMGRPDKCIAAALKAQVLTLAASPLFSCNSDYADYIDNRGIQLFPQDKSAEKEKWKRAADAAQTAIDLAEEGLHRLYDAHIDFPNARLLSEETVLSLQVKNAATERWNEEIIWGNCRTNGHTILQRFCTPYFAIVQMTGNAGIKSWAPPLHIVEQFYTKNGLPIEDDADWVTKLAYKDQHGIWAMRTATADDRQYIRQGNKTIELHFNREARFYGAISFDEGTFFGNNTYAQDNSYNAGTLFVTQYKHDMLNGLDFPDRSTLTGYLCKKLVHYRSVAPPSANSYTTFPYAFPIIRLADLFLLRAEAMNEYMDAPNEDVYFYIDSVRSRTGLKGVVETWSEHAVVEKKDLPLTKMGMREIIRRERLNELAFEGHRYWDIRRWKLAENYLNRPVRGLSILEPDEKFYDEVELYPLQFEKKDYFTPIRTEVVITNSNLLQSPYWGVN